MSFAAGWYADPSRPGGLRWWDGSAWTSAVADAPRTAPVLVPGAVPVEAGSLVDDRGFSAMDLLVPRARSLATRALVWGIVAVLLPVAILPAVMAVVFGAGGLDRGKALHAVGHPAEGRRRSIAGIVLGIASVLLLVGLVVVGPLVF